MHCAIYHYLDTYDDASNGVIHELINARASAGLLTGPLPATPASLAWLHSAV
jgi:hypothetical protein